VSGEDHFLARWSKRKRQVEAAEAAHPPVPSPETGEAASAHTAEPGEGPETALGIDHPPPRADAARPLPSRQQRNEPDPAVQGGETELQSLPRIEDLSADSDLTAFLREGVPESLKRAALRRAWSLDPAIRDYVSPADYAWDFNDPASIPGFGGRITPAALGSLGQAIDAALAADLQPGNAGSAQPTEAEPAPLAEAKHPPDPAQQARAEIASPALPSALGTSGDFLDGAAAEGSGPQTGMDEPPDRSPRHGGAVPR